MIRATLNGIEFLFDDEEQAARFALRFGNLTERTEKPVNTGRNGQRGPGRPRKNANGKLDADVRSEASMSMSLGFLRAVEQSGPSGIHGPQLVAQFKLKNPRAVGGVVVAARNALRNCGFEPANAYSKRGKPGHRRWIAAPRIAEAIKLLEAQGGARP
jgi:hypothetical protein